ncbi:polysaccharide pyruvyl transferase family protein [Falsihalocynthiibacter sp. BN13B15]|uniref:polysaccharide pyruvyl transferase family protein n=1 Tax=Falsihalocynthiibacter sp. BN13B15 TaxID=3240871 RepID=UPI003510A5F7
MKIGLLTYHFSDNYGALYQAYALRQWFTNRGIEADFINYHPSYVEEGGPLDRPWKPSLWRKNATICYMKLSHYRRQLFGNHSQHAAFESFRRDSLGVIGPPRRTGEALRANIADCDMLVCGSDQIWNPSIQRGLDPVYFLNIPGTDHARKVAYAPSFGRSTIEAEHHAELGQLLQGLDGISVRETSGLGILTSTGMPLDRARVVPDPTILLGKFDAHLQGDVAPNDSVFCYALRTDQVIREVAETAAKLTGGPLYAPQSSRQRWRDIGQGVAPGPVEWLRMLARAQLVVSNSFHGIALSIVLNRPFIAVMLPGKRVGMNARASNLLAMTGLTERMVETADPTALSRLVNSPIDWDASNSRLAAMRAEGEDYLAAEILKVGGRDA